MATLTVQEAAQELGLGPRALYTWLRRQRVIDAGNVPYRHYLDTGLLSVRYGHWHHPRAGVRYYARPLITDRGLKWLRGRMEEVG